MEVTDGDPSLLSWGLQGEEEEKLSKHYIRLCSAISLSSLNELALLPLK